MTTAFNLVQQLKFYNAYHSNDTNVLIHRICVPFIIWSALGLLDCVSGKYAAITATVYQLYYIILSVPIGLSYLPQLLIMLYTAHSLNTHTNHSVAIFTLTQIVSWIAQFYGHARHERRAPALLDNLVGAIFLAPFFVHIENLVTLGYCRQLREQIKK